MKLNNTDFHLLKIDQRQHVRDEFMSHDNLFKTLYNPIRRFKVNSVTPEDVWHESCILVTRLASINCKDREIEIRAIYDDLHDRYREFFSNEEDVSQMRFLVLYTLFFMLLDEYDKVEGHPHLQIVRILKGFIEKHPCYHQLFEAGREEEDKMEAENSPIEIKDYINTIPNTKGRGKAGRKKRSIFVNEVAETIASALIPQLKVKYFRTDTNRFEVDSVTFTIDQFYGCLYFAFIENRICVEKINIAGYHTFICSFYKDECCMRQNLNIFHNNFVNQSIQMRIKSKCDMLIKFLKNEIQRTLESNKTA